MNSENNSGSNSRADTPYRRRSGGLQLRGAESNALLNVAAAYSSSSKRPLPQIPESLLPSSSSSTQTRNLRAQEPEQEQQQQQKSPVVDVAGVATCSDRVWERPKSRQQFNSKESSAVSLLRLGALEAIGPCPARLVKNTTTTTTTTSTRTMTMGGGARSRSRSGSPQVAPVPATTMTSTLRQQLHQRRSSSISSSRCSSTASTVSSFNNSCGGFYDDDPLATKNRGWKSDAGNSRSSSAVSIGACSVSSALHRPRTTHHHLSPSILSLAVDRRSHYNEMEQQKRENERRLLSEQCPFRPTILSAAPVKKTPSTQAEQQQQRHHLAPSRSAALQRENIIVPSHVTNLSPPRLAAKNPQQQRMETLSIQFVPVISSSNDNVCGESFYSHAHSRAHAAPSPCGGNNIIIVTSAFEKVVPLGLVSKPLLAVPSPFKVREEEDGFVEFYSSSNAPPVALPAAGKQATPEARRTAAAAAAVDATPPPPPSSSDEDDDTADQKKEEVSQLKPQQQEQEAQSAAKGDDVYFSPPPFSPTPQKRFQAAEDEAVAVTPFFHASDSDDDVKQQEMKGTAPPATATSSSSITLSLQQLLLTATPEIIKNANRPTMSHEVASACDPSPAPAHLDCPVAVSPSSAGTAQSTAAAGFVVRVHSNYTQELRLEAAQKQQQHIRHASIQSKQLLMQRRKKMQDLAAKRLAALEAELAQGKESSCRRSLSAASSAAPQHSPEPAVFDRLYSLSKLCSSASSHSPSAAPAASSPPTCSPSQNSNNANNISVQLQSPQDSPREKPQRETNALVVSLSQQRSSSESTQEESRLSESRGKMPSDAFDFYSPAYRSSKAGSAGSTAQEAEDIINASNVELSPELGQEEVFAAALHAAQCSEPNEVFYWKQQQQQQKQRRQRPLRKRDFIDPLYADDDELLDDGKSSSGSAAREESPRVVFTPRQVSGSIVGLVPQMLQAQVDDESRRDGTVSRLVSVSTERCSDDDAIAASQQLHSVSPESATRRGVYPPPSIDLLESVIAAPVPIRGLSLRTLSNHHRN